MTISATVQNFLDGRGIGYDVLTHSHTTTSSRTAEACHVSGDALAKAVLLKGRQAYLLAIVPASCRVDLDNVSDLLDEPFSVASEEEIAELFADCDRGAIPPLAAAFGLESVVDARLDTAPDVYLEAGDHCSVIHLTQPQFAGLTWDSYHGKIAARQ